MTTTREALIKRLEKETEGSREIDYAIARVVMPWLANAEIMEGDDPGDIL